MTTKKFKNINDDNFANIVNSVSSIWNKLSPIEKVEIDGWSIFLDNKNYTIKSEKKHLFKFRDTKPDEIVSTIQSILSKELEIITHSTDTNFVECKNKQFHYSFKNPDNFLSQALTQLDLYPHCMGTQKIDNETKMVALIDNVI